MIIRLKQASILTLTMLLASCADAKEGEAKAAEPAPAVVQTDGLPAYYNVSDNVDRLTLIHLGEMEDGSAVIVPVTSVSRRPENVGLGNVWRLNCGQETMEILQSVPISPGHVGNVSTFDQPQQLRARASAENWEIYRLGCDGSAQLDRQRVIMDAPNRTDDLQVLVKNFWR